MKLTLIGSSSTGKTHYAGQLYGRLRHGTSRLRLRCPPKSLVALDNILQMLADGKSADHTQADVYEELDFPLVTDTGSEFDLLFPDYGGEQVKSMIQTRTIPDPWVKRLRDADGWILFVRPSLVPKMEDFINRPPGGSIPRPLKKTQEPREHGFVPTDSSFIELLQAALAVNKMSLLTRRRDPLLTVFLSCWDELFPEFQTSHVRPFDVLYEHLPMFAEFLRSNWSEGRLLVYGLSSLGKELHKNKADNDYIERGPENFGWIVKPDGEADFDLTVPLLDILNLKSNGS